MKSLPIQQCNLVLPGSNYEQTYRNKSMTMTRLKISKTL
ncbi:molecular chaperone OsmY, partial [Shigella flexneri]|nr:molecular chaperone OsmY [Shigella flexneri]